MLATFWLPLLQQQTQWQLSFGPRMGMVTSPWGGWGTTAMDGKPEEPACAPCLGDSPACPPPRPDTYHFPGQ